MKHHNPTFINGYPAPCPNQDLTQYLGTRLVAAPRPQGCPPGYRPVQFICAFCGVALNFADVVTDIPSSFANRETNRRTQ